MPANPARPAVSDRPARATAKAVRPFLGLLDPIIVDAAGEFDFDGAVAMDDVAAVWVWMLRDLAADLVNPRALDDNEASRQAIDSLLPELLTRADATVAAAATDAERARRLMTQLGGEDSWRRMPVVLDALRHRALLDKAQAFGRSINGLPDEAGVALALQSMPLADRATAPFVLHAMVGQVANPSRLITAAIRLAGGATEALLFRHNFGPLVDAMLAHAQNQIPHLSQSGTFGDTDLMCRAIDRFHRLMRAVTSYVELGRNSRWSSVAGSLIGTVSARLEPRLRDVAPDLNKSLRRRDGTDRIDGDQVLSALNGMYLLATIRDCRDSLALNTLFDQVWTQTGQALEIHIDRLLEALRVNPADTVVAGRLDAALKMSEIRFGKDFADTLRHAKDIAERRVS